MCIRDRYRYAQGIKTGSTPEAGYCLISSALRGSRHMISVVLGAERVTLEDGVTIQTRSFSETSRMFDSVSYTHLDVYKRQ